MKRLKANMARWDEYAIHKSVEEAGKLNLVKNLIIKLDLSDEQVADVAEVRKEFVQHVRKGLTK